MVCAATRLAMPAKPSTEVAQPRWCLRFVVCTRLSTQESAAGSMRTVASATLHPVAGPHFQQAWQECLVYVRNSETGRQVMGGTLNAIALGQRSAPRRISESGSDADAARHRVLCSTDANQMLLVCTTWSGQASSPASAMQP